MPYPLPTDEEVAELLEPRERLIFDAMQRQSQLSQVQINAYRQIALLAVIMGFALGIIGLLNFITLVWRLFANAC